ncbi:large ribosomal subunit protein bL34m isoform X1 [Crocuta crocuta]
MENYTPLPVRTLTLKGRRRRTATPGGPGSHADLVVGETTFPIRWLQSRAWLGLPDAWGLVATQQNRGKARGNEYQPSNIKRKHKHGWIRRLSTPAGVQVILRRLHKGRKSLSH